MASLINDPRGLKRILFIGPDGVRRAIRLGKMSKRDAEAVKLRVEHLVTAKITGHAVNDETARWVADLKMKMADKLARVDLIPKKEVAVLGPFVSSYIDNHPGKRGTILVMNHTLGNLLEHFDKNIPLRDVTPGDADEFFTFLRSKLAESTARRRCGVAKQFFTAARRKRLITENPFEGLTTSATANRSRDYFITREESSKVLDACPDAQWRLLFALSRYGGLRCPSEHVSLTWGDIDWDRDRFTVTSSKTEHHEGHETRVVPIYPELRPYLEQVFDDAEPGTEHVITRYRDTNSNLRTQLNRIIRCAGLEPWPKLFQNLRATRQTELEEQFGSHVACKWIGNSERIARKHYLQVTDEHYRRAAAQKEAQQASVTPRKDSPAPCPLPHEPRAMPALASECDSVLTNRVRLAGFEPATYALGKHCSIP